MLFKLYKINLTLIIYSFRRYTELGKSQWRESHGFSNKGETLTWGGGGNKLPK